jgi:hypothetical protein
VATDVEGRSYRIVRQLGQGGMAVVFEGVLSGAHGFTRRVAIKRIADGVAAGPQMIERFLDEARIASRLHHAGIVGVIDYGVVDGLPFQVLELVDGIDGESLLVKAGGKLPVDAALILAGDVAHALDHAHRATDDDGRSLGIVHRDVKPSNILVSWSGDVKLTDFGIAVARNRLAATEAGTTRGTVAFMAPEQRTASGTDPRTDVFALGCTLHALITGDSPIADVSVAMRVITGEPAPLSPDVPPEIAAVIARAIAPSPDARFPSAGAMADAIGPLLAHRLQRDARGRLRDLLAEIRGEPKPAAGGLLDRLLAVELVLAGPDAPGGTRQFVARPTEAVAPSPIAAPRRSRRRLAAGIVGLLAIGGAVAGVAIATRDDDDAVAVADAATVAVADADVVTVTVAVTDATTDAGAVIVAVADAAGRRREKPDARIQEDRDKGDGYVQVVGAEFSRAQIFIDGKKVGSSPERLKVAVGKHQLVVVKQDGTRVGPFSIEITSFHTYSSPLKPRL